MLIRKYDVYIIMRKSEITYIGNKTKERHEIICYVGGRIGFVTINHELQTYQSITIFF